MRNTTRRAEDAQPRALFSFPSAHPGEELPRFGGIVGLNGGVWNRGPGLRLLGFAVAQSQPNQVRREETAARNPARTFPRCVAVSPLGKGPGTPPCSGHR